MQVACHVLWPRAPWLYHRAIFLVTLSFLASGGSVSKLDNANIKNSCSLLGIHATPPVVFRFVFWST